MNEHVDYLTDPARAEARARDVAARIRCTPDQTERLVDLYRERATRNADRIEHGLEPSPFPGAGSRHADPDDPLDAAARIYEKLRGSHTHSLEQPAGPTVPGSLRSPLEYAPPRQHGRSGHIVDPVEEVIKAGQTAEDRRREALGLDRLVETDLEEHGEERAYHRGGPVREPAKLVSLESGSVLPADVLAAFRQRSAGIVEDFETGIRSVRYVLETSKEKLLERTREQLVDLDRQCRVLDGRKTLLEAFERALEQSIARTAEPNEGDRPPGSE